MAKPAPHTAEFIPAGSYPPVMRRCDAVAFLRMAKSPEIVNRMTRALAARRAQIGEAVKAGAVCLEAAARDGDAERIYGEAHEIRGLAHLAGLTASGCIADRLCHYLDAVARAGLPVDAGIVALHVSAVLCAARATDEATRLGNKVADELAALVARKLGSAAP